MATGILAVGCRLLGIPTLPTALMSVALAGCVTRWCLTALRALRHRERILADFRSHQRAPGFFTTVAATSVVGTNLVAAPDGYSVARVLWWVAFVLWLVLTYAIFAA